MSYGPAQISRQLDLGTAVQIGDGVIEVFSFRAFNLSGSTIFLQLFNLNSVPTLGSSVVMTIPISDTGAHVEVKPSRGSNLTSLFPSFNVGFGIGAATTADGSSAAGAGVIVNIEYFR